MNKISLALIILISTNQIVFSKDIGLEDLLSGEKRFSVQEQSAIVNIYKTAEKEGLFPDIIKNRAAEGIAKKAPGDKISAALNQELERLRWIKLFCKESAETKLVVPFDFKNAEKLIFAFQQKLSNEDITKLHGISVNNRLKQSEYFEILKSVSMLSRKGFNIAESQNIINMSFETGKNVGYIRKILNIYMKTDKSQEGLVKEILMKGIKGNRNLFDLEEEIDIQIKDSSTYREKHFNNTDETGERLRKSAGNGAGSGEGKGRGGK